MTSSFNVSVLVCGECVFQELSENEYEEKTNKLKTLKKAFIIMTCNLVGSTTHSHLKLIFSSEYSEMPCLLASSTAFEKTDAIFMPDNLFYPFSHPPDLPSLVFIPDNMNYH